MRLQAGFACSLTLITAPAGFGKTTLVSEWIGAYGIPNTEYGMSLPAFHAEVCWLSLDEGDNDPVRFWTYVIAALQTVHTKLGTNALLLLQSAQPTPDAMLATLINELNGCTAPIVLVLDDYHRITHPLIQQAVAYLIDQAPPPLHLFLLSRTLPPLPVARWRLDRQLNELGVADLRLTPVETALLFNEGLHLRLPPVALERLAARTEGWIAGLQLAALTLQMRPAGESDQTNRQWLAFVDQFSGGHEHVFAYLAQEVLAQQPAEIQAFLRQSAQFERFCAPLCDAVRQRQDSQALLQTLLQRNLFLIPLDTQRQWYRYHQLFGEFLRAQSAGQPDVQLHQRASAWFQANGYLSEAVHHALTAGDAVTTVGVVAAAVADALPRGEFVSALAWLNQLPDDLVRQEPELAIYKGWLLLFQGELKAAAAYANTASAQVTPATPGVTLGRLTGLRAALASEHEEDTAAIELAYEALEQLEDQDPFFPGLLLMNLAEAQRARGAFAAALETHRQVYRHHRHAKQRGVALVALSNLAHLLYRQGQRQAALALCQEAIGQDLAEHGQPTSLAAGVHLIMGIMQLTAYVLAEARDQLVLSLRLSEEARLNDYAVSALCQLGFLHQALGEAAQARQALERAKQQAVQPYTKAAVAAVAAAIELANGNLAAATHWAHTVDFD
jgi:LuxR family transcriptional regulator, maltose regulon positive regulatory protein